MPYMPFEQDEQFKPGLGGLARGLMNALFGNPDPSTGGFRPGAISMLPYAVGAAFDPLRAGQYLARGGEAMAMDRYRRDVVGQRKAEFDAEQAALQQGQAAFAPTDWQPTQDIPVTPQAGAPDPMQSRMALQQFDPTGTAQVGDIGRFSGRQAGLLSALAKTGEFNQAAQAAREFMPQAEWIDETANGLPGQRSAKTNKFDPFPQQPTPASNDISVRNVDVGDTQKLGRFDKQGNFLGYVTDQGGAEITAPRYKPTPENADPFQGRGQTIQFMNMLIRGKTDPALRATPGYEAAYSYLQRPQVSWDELGRPVYTTPDVSWALPPEPAGGQQSDRAPGQPTITTGPQVKPLDTPRAVAMANMEQATKDAAIAREMFFPGGKFDRTITGQAQANVPFTKGREARQAVRRAVEVLLRLRTGAAAPQTEVDNYTAMFSPSILDTEEGATRKMDQLQAFFEETQRLVGAGPQSGAQSAPQQGQGAAEAPPEGIDPEVWQEMTPEQKALWQR